MRILFFIGTRPEAIKMMSPIIQLKKDKFNIKVCSTGQHTDLLDDVFKVFNFKPDFKYKIFDPHNNINKTFSEIVKVASKAIVKSKTNLVFVHGDTLNTFACATAAFNLNIKLAHLEAGLRSFDRYFPWPEEVYRRVVTSLSDIHFAPTIISKKNLLNENINKKKVFVIGNTVIDSLKYVLNKSKKSKKFTLDFKFFLKNIRFNKLNYNILVTCHRREQIGENIISLCKQIQRITKINNIKVFFVLHHNPKIVNPVKKYLGENKNVSLIKPLKYDYFLNFIKVSNLIITDSGGIQEELTILNKKCLINRDVTERVEMMDNQNFFLIGSNSSNLYSKFYEIYKTKDNKTNKKSKINKYYGIGNSSKKISKILQNKIEI